MSAPILSNSPAVNALTGRNVASSGQFAVFAMRWTLLSLASTVIPILLTTIPSPEVFQNSSNRLLLLYYLGAAFFLLISLCATQWFLLRAYLERPRIWAAVTGVGFVFGCAVAVLTIRQAPQYWWKLYHNPDEMIDSIILPSTLVGYLTMATAGALFGLVLGGLQIVTLASRRYLKALWVVTCVVALTGCFIVLELLGHLDSEGMFSVFGQSPTEKLFWLPRAAITFAAPMLTYACLTSAPLWFILMRSKSSSMKQLLDRFD